MNNETIKTKSSIFWRLLKVVYFIISLPIFFGAGYAVLTSQTIYRGNAYFSINDYYLGIIYLILVILGYIFFTDLLRRIISYITDGNFNGFFPYIKIIKGYFWWILIIGFFLFASLSDSSKVLRNECTGNNEGFNDYGSCVCYEGYIRENNICKKDIKKYDDGNISFEYPGKLLVSNKEFEVFNFFDNENIYVKKYNFKTLIGECISTIALTYGNSNKYKESKLTTDMTNEYTEILKNIQLGKTENNILDHFSCNSTYGAISTNPVEINGIKGVIINYYFSQDDRNACLTQFNTELLLVKDLDNIYSIMFKNNFGNVLSYLNQFKGDYGEACLYPNVSEYTAKESSDSISNFYKYGTSLIGTNYESFEENYGIINDIIKSVKIKDNLKKTNYSNEIIKQDVNLREGAGADFSIIKALIKGEYVDVLDSTYIGKNQWFKVNSNGDIGWISNIGFQENKNVQSLADSKKLFGYWFSPSTAVINITFYNDGSFLFNDFNGDKNIEEVLTGTFELIGENLTLKYDDRPYQSFRFYKGNGNDDNYYISNVSGYYFVKQ